MDIYRLQLPVQVITLEKVIGRVMIILREHLTICEFMIEHYPLMRQELFIRVTSKLSLFWVVRILMYMFIGEMRMGGRLLNSILHQMTIGIPVLNLGSCQWGNSRQAFLAYKRVKPTIIE